MEYIIFLLALGSFGSSKQEEMPGSWEQQSVDLNKWQDILNSDILTFEKKGLSVESLTALGQPDSLKTQVVAGTNFEWGFPDGSIVEIFEQIWTQTLVVTDIEGPEAEDKKETKEMKRAKETVDMTIDYYEPEETETETESETETETKTLVLEKEHSGAWKEQNVEEYMPKWHEIVQTATFRPAGLTSESLNALGRPTKVETEVVAGKNYRFTFADKTSVTVFEQSWTKTLLVTDFSQGKGKKEKKEPKEVEFEEPEKPESKKPKAPQLIPLDPAEFKKPPRLQPLEPEETEHEGEETLTGKPCGGSNNIPCEVGFKCVFGKYTDPYLSMGKCVEETPMCLDSPMQLCKMMCFDMPHCKPGECLMREGNCCNFECEKVSEIQKEPEVELMKENETCDNGYQTWECERGLTCQCVGPSCTDPKQPNFPRLCVKSSGGVPALEPSELVPVTFQPHEPRLQSPQALNPSEGNGKQPIPTSLLVVIAAGVLLGIFSGIGCQYLCSREKDLDDVYQDIALDTSSTFRVV